MPRKEETPLDVPRDLAMREFSEWLTGRPLPAGKQVTNPSKEQRFTAEVMLRAAWEGFATVLFAARRGNLRAALYLLDRCLGTPDKPFAEAVQEMSVSEARIALRDEYLRMGLTPKSAEALVDRACAGDLSALNPLASKE